MAAQAAECAADQNKFWEFHDTLFASQNGENQGAFSNDNLKKFAADLGLDTAAFNQCLDTQKYAQIVESDTQIAQQIGVRSTPSFVVNGNPLIGAQPIEEFERLIQQFGAP